MKFKLIFFTLAMVFAFMGHSHQTETSFNKQLYQFSFKANKTDSLNQTQVLKVLKVKWDPLLNISSVNVTEEVNLNKTNVNVVSTVPFVTSRHMVNICKSDKQTAIDFLPYVLEIDNLVDVGLNCEILPVTSIDGYTNRNGTTNVVNSDSKVQLDCSLWLIAVVGCWLIFKHN